MSPPNIGPRIRRLRQQEDWTQSELARRAGITQEAVSAIEAGKRAPGLDVITRMAAAFGVTVDALLREEESPFEVLLRGEELTEADLRCVRRFVDLCRHYAELEELTGQTRSVAPEYPPRRRSEDRCAYAERVATEERRRLGLGDQPVGDLAAIVEDQGGHVLALECAPDRLDGAFLFSETEGAFILLNTARAPERQLFTLAHEYGHFLLHRRRGTILDVDLFAAGETDEAEKTANAFAAAFLMPASLIRAWWGQRSKPHWLELIRLRRHLGVSYRALGWRLLNLGCITAESRAQLEPGEALLSQREQELFPFRPRTMVPPLSERMAELALEAFLQDKITTSYLVEALDTDIVTAQRRAALAREMAELALP
jgi:Zn-dependent peptidase ImmA (M78 family)/DNA-binding XRE family transcriptional regulator